MSDSSEGKTPVRSPGRVDVTVIMCVHNEMGRIQPALEDLLESRRVRQETVEIIILDNLSSDGTREWLESVEGPDIQVVFNEANLGKGGSIRRGIALSSGRYVVVHDPDLEYQGSDVWRLLDAARTEQADMALGSRVLGGNIAYKYLQNYIGVRFLTSVINLLYGSRLTDSATAMKLIDGEVARGLRLTSTGFDLDFELVARVLRLEGKVIEMRIQYSPRTIAEGKKVRAVRDGALALRVIVRDRLLPRSRFVLSPRASPAAARQ